MFNSGIVWNLLNNIDLQRFDRILKITVNFWIDIFLQRSHWNLGRVYGSFFDHTFSWRFHYLLIFINLVNW